MSTLGVIFEERNRLLLALYVMVENGGIGPNWMFDDAKKAIGDRPKALARLLQEGITKEEEFEGKETTRSKEYRRLLAELDIDQ